jgi:outer membrane protein assembly factor BamD (BamD/ComL family)
MKSHWVLGILLVSLLCPLAFAAERATLVREAVIYISPDNGSAKLGNAERGRELIILETSRDWIHVSALLGPQRAPDAAFIEDDDEDQQKTITGWVQGKGVVGASVPNGDKIVFGEAASSEDQASRRAGRKGAAQDAMRLYRRVFDYFPSSPLAGEALYRAADIRWQLEKSDVMSRPSAKARESYLREGMNEDWMKQVIKKFPGTKWAELASFLLIDNKLCGDWQGSTKCPEKEADLYEKYAKEHPNSPAAAQALYDAAWRRAALIEMYKSDEQQKKSDEAKNSTIALTQRIISQYPQQTDWATRAQDLLYLVQQGIPTYGNATE